MITAITCRSFIGFECAPSAKRHDAPNDGFQIIKIPYSAVARKGGGDFKLVMIQSSQPVWSRREEPNLSESSLAGWAPVLRLRCAQPRRVQARYASPQSPPAKLDSDKFGSSRRDKTGWLDF